MTTLFDRTTALREIGTDRYEAEITRDWWIGVGPNGGLVAALLLKAASETVAEPARAPRTLTVHYLAAPREGSAELTSVIERAGRGVTFTSTRLIQDGRLCAVAMSAHAMPRDPLRAWRAEAMPGTPPPDECPPVESGYDDPAMRQVWDARWAIRPSTDDYIVGGWARLADRRHVDVHVLAAMADGWMPPLMAAGAEGITVPTMELTVHFRADARNVDFGPEHWCFARFESTTGHEGFLNETGEIWAADGTLLVQCRQLAVMLALPPT